MPELFLWCNLELTSYGAWFEHTEETHANDADAENPAHVVLRVVTAEIWGFHW